jgi:hypothetical protein
VRRFRIDCVSFGLDAVQFGSVMYSLVVVFRAAASTLIRRGDDAVCTGEVADARSGGRSALYCRFCWSVFCSTCILK